MDFNAKQVLPPKSWEDFEELCLVLFRALWKDINAQKNGRKGQPQRGVDVFGSPGGDSEQIWGIQCKGKDGLYGSPLTTTEMDAEICKAERFQPRLSRFLIATTAPRDASLQEHARIISQRRALTGDFGVHVFGWEDVQSLLADHPAVIQRFYPEQACDLAALIESLRSITRTSADWLKAIEHTLGQQRQAKETSSAGFWRDLKFDVSRDLGPALMGRPLGPGDANACPRLLEADVLVRQLRIAYSGRLIGVPGSGKSVCACQTAYTFAAEGWRVLRLEDPETGGVQLEAGDARPTLFLIDNAHLMPEGQLSRLEEQACSNRMLLSIHTAFEEVSGSRGAIYLDAKRAVSTIAFALKANPVSTLAAVRKADDRVGLGMMHEDLDRRIDQAREASEFPWQFCFTLGGGWRRAQLVAGNAKQNGADLVLAVAAAQQMAARDAKTTLDRITSLGAIAGVDVRTVTAAINWLVAERLLLAPDDLRCPHQRFSSAIIGPIYNGLDPQKRDGFCRVCRAILEDLEIRLVGCQILIRELAQWRNYSGYGYQLEAERLLDKTTLHSLLDRCWHANSSDDRSSACNLLVELQGAAGSWPVVLVGDRLTQLASWIGSADEISAFGLGRVVNDLYNFDPTIAAALVAQCDPAALAARFNESSPLRSYSLIHLAERISLCATPAWKARFVSAVDQSRLKTWLHHWPQAESVELLSDLCSILGRYDEELGFNLLREAIPAMQNALTASPVKAFRGLESTLVYFLRVWHPLGSVKNWRPDRRRKTIAKTIFALLEPVKTAALVSSVPLRNIQSAAFFLTFLQKIRPKATDIVRQNLDWSLLAKTIGTDWQHLSHEESVFLHIASQGQESREIVAQVIREHSTQIRVFPPMAAWIDLESAYSVVEHGGIVDLASDMGIRWKLVAYIVHEFAKNRPDLMANLLSPHESKATAVLQSEQTNLYDDAEYFIQVLNECAPAILNRILSAIDPESAKRAWTACLSKSGKPKRVAALLIEHCLLLEGPVGAMAKRLRTKYPRGSRPAPAADPK